MPKPLRTNRKLVKLWKGLDPEQKRAFARLISSTVENLRQYVHGRRVIHPELAVRLEKASLKAASVTMIVLDRTELSETCGRCEYARAFKKLEKQ